MFATVPFTNIEVEEGEEEEEVSSPISIEDVEVETGVEEDAPIEEAHAMEVPPPNIATNCHPITLGWKELRSSPAIEEGNN